MQTLAQIAASIPQIASRDPVKLTKCGTTSDEHSQVEWSKDELGREYVRFTWTDAHYARLFKASLDAACMSRYGDFDLATLEPYKGGIKPDLVASEYLDQGKSLTFYGPPGTRKTTLAVCIAKKACFKRKSVVFKRWIALYQELRRAVGSRDPDDERKLIDALRAPALLVIDELGRSGKSKCTEYEADLLFQILSERDASGKCQIITTNLTRGEISQVYGEGTADRVFDSYRVYSKDFSGESKWR